MNHPQQHLAVAKTALLTLIFLFGISGCFAPDANKPLKNTYWSLTELDGEASTNVPDQPEVHLVFHINDNTMHGSDGCNRIQGSYIRHAESFVFESIISTRMHCPQGMKQADLFLQALRKTDTLKIEEDNLILYAADIELARFEAKDEY